MPWMIPIAIGIAAAGGAITNKASQDAAKKGDPNAIDLPDVFKNQQYQQATGQVQGNMADQQSFLQALQGQGGIQNQSNVFNQEQGLATQLGDMAQGGGPNPAMAQLANTTGQNIAAQSAMMAGQRGAGANVGLAGRQAAMAGSSMQQQATGQAAAMRAQQQLAAIGALQQQQGMMGGLATQQVGQQGAELQNIQRAAANQQQMAANIQGGQNQLALQQQQGLNQIKHAAAQADAARTAEIGKMVTGAAGSAMGGAGGMPGGGGGGGGGSSAGPSLGALPSGGGGNIFGVQTQFADGGQVGVNAPASPAAPAKDGPKSRIAQMLISGGRPAAPMMMAYGGRVPAMVSPGEIYLTPNQADRVAQGKMNPLAGERIPGKAKVAGDSLKNDTVPKDLEAGGVVVKRTKARDPKEAAKFVAAIKAKGGRR